MDFNKNYFLPYIRTLGIVKAIFDHDDNLGVERLPDPNKGICLEEAALHLNLVVEEGIEDNNDQESLPSRTCYLSNCKIESHKSLRPYDIGNFGNYQTIVIHLNAMNYQPYNLCRKYWKNPSNWFIFTNSWNHITIIICRYTWWAILIWSKTTVTLKTASSIPALSRGMTGMCPKITLIFIYAYCCAI